MDHWSTKLVVEDYCDFLGYLHTGVEELIVGDNIQLEEEMVHLDFHYVQQLRTLQIGEGSFIDITRVKLIGMKKLESVMIGNESFHVEVTEEEQSGLFVKDCPLLKEFRIGTNVFDDYDVCVFENLPSLEVLALGDTKERSCNFYDASLELKRVCLEWRLCADLPKLRLLSFGVEAFHNCERVVLESALGECV